MIPGTTTTTRTVCLVTAGLAFIVTSCGSADPPATGSSVDQSTTNAVVTTTSDQVDASVSSSVAAVRAVRVFDVGGVEVVVVIDTIDLPERAVAVEFAGMLIDPGSGPEICVVGVDDSLPPQCDGLVVDGLDMSGWAEEAQGVWWGDRAVSVTWPPVNNHVQLLSDTSIEETNFIYPPRELPVACEAIDRFVPNDVVQDYARGLGEPSGGLYVTNNGELVLQVTNDPEPHRQALAAGDAEACIVQVKWTETELQRIKTDLEPQLMALIPYASASASGSAGRVEIVVPVADLDTIQKVAALVDQPESLRVIGRAILLDS